jgi:hypothetical protein
MDRQPITSSMIRAIGYDADTGTLEIEFLSDGSVWQYFDVPAGIWGEFQYCDSHGRFWHANIKNRYRELRVG